MMRLLLVDIAGNHRFIAPRVGEGSIAIGPPLEQRKLPVLLEPDGGCGFNVAHVISQSDAGVQIGEHVDVILHAIDAIEKAMFVFNDAGYVSIQLIAMLRGKGRLPVFGTEDDVIQDLSVA